MHYTEYAETLPPPASAEERRARASDERNANRLFGYVGTVDMDIHYWPALLARLKSFSKGSWADVQRSGLEAIPETDPRRPMKRHDSEGE